MQILDHDFECLVELFSLQHKVYIMFMSTNAEQLSYDWYCMYVMLCHFCFSVHFLKKNKTMLSSGWRTYYKWSVLSFSRTGFIKDFPDKFITCLSKSFISWMTQKSCPLLHFIVVRIMSVMSCPCLVKNSRCGYSVLRRIMLPPSSNIHRSFPYMWT